MDELAVFLVLLGIGLFISGPVAVIRGQDRIRYLWRCAHQTDGARSKTRCAGCCGHTCAETACRETKTPSVDYTAKTHRGFKAP
ncbi:MAG: hypothetical protein ACYSO3_02300 [Planctomycetota bacterium]